MAVFRGLCYDPIAWIHLKSEQQETRGEGQMETQAQPSEHIPS